MAAPLSLLSVFLATAFSGVWATGRQVWTDACAGSSDDDPLCMATDKGLLQVKGILYEEGQTGQADVQEVEAEKSMHGGSKQKRSRQQTGRLHIPRCMKRKWRKYKDQMNILVPLKRKTQQDVLNKAKEVKATDEKEYAELESDLNVIHDDIMTNEVLGQNGVFDEALYEKIASKWRKYQSTHPGNNFAKTLDEMKGQSSDEFAKAAASVKEQKELWGDFAYDLELLGTHKFLHGCPPKPKTTKKAPPKPKPAPVPRPTLAPTPPPTLAPTPPPTLAPTPAPTPYPNFWTGCYSTLGCKLKDKHTRRRQNHRDECIFQECIDRKLEWNQDMWAKCPGQHALKYYNDVTYKGWCAERKHADFWTQPYEDNQCKQKLPGIDKGGKFTRRRENYRDNCIQHECMQKGLEWKSWKWADKGNWKFAGECGLPRPPDAPMR